MRLLRPRATVFALLFAAAALPWPSLPAAARSESVASADAVSRAWRVDPARSRLGFEGTLGGGGFEGQFTRFRAGIDFDPNDLPRSRFRVEVDLASADTKDAERDGALRGPEFFATGRWPVARFETTGFRALGGDRYEARGNLALRDRTREVVVAFRFTPSPDGRSASLDGGTVVNRLEFGVGQGEWQDTTWLADAVRVRFALMLTRSESQR